MSNLVTAGEDAFRNGGWFTTTHWSIVLAAGEGESLPAQAALETLCHLYWPPLYVYVRRRGYSPEETQDLVQDFFARFLEKKYFAQADPRRGRFRNFLLTAIQHFLANEQIKNHRQKRGGGEMVVSWDARQAEQGYVAEPVDTHTPERLFERRWAFTILERTLAMLREECVAAGKGPAFEELRHSVWGEKSGVSYAELGVRLGWSENSVKVTVHRLRQRYGQLLRAEIAQTVTQPEEVEEELHCLIRAVSE